MPATATEERLSTNSADELSAAPEASIESLIASEISTPITDDLPGAQPIELERRVRVHLEPAPVSAAARVVAPVRPSARRYVVAAALVLSMVTLVAARTALSSCARARSATATQPHSSRR